MTLRLTMVMLHNSVTEIRCLLSLRSSHYPSFGHSMQAFLLILPTTSQPYIEQTLRLPQVFHGNMRINFCSLGSFLSQQLESILRSTQLSSRWVVELCL